MSRFSRLILLTFLLACSGPEPADDAPAETTAIERLRARYAADKRTDRVEVTVRDGVLTGYTTVADARDSLEELAAALGLRPEVRLLPDAAVGELTAGIVRVSVANLRSQPGHSQELATQALLGTPLAVLDEQDGWFLVRTPDRYLAWLEPGAFHAASPAAVTAWLDGELVRYLPAAGVLRAMPGGGAVVTDLVAGNLLQLTDNSDKAFAEVRLPDGTTGWLPSSDVAPYHSWKAPTTLPAPELLATAAGLAGRPYLWGGTSAKGMDCSGFTKTAYYLHGFVIPRDASQQVHAGNEVPLDSSFAALLPGDLLFFGNLRDDGSQRITHVGFFLGDGRFLHAGADNGRITENSLLTGDPLYAAHRRKSLLRVKRLAPDTYGVRTVAAAFAATVGAAGL